MKNRIFLLVVSTLLFSCSRTSVDFMVQTSDDTSAPASFSFDNTSDEFESYFWDFGDGFSSEDISPEHTYYLSGKYDVVLKGISGKKSKVTTKEIIVTAPKKCLVQLETEHGDMLIELYDITPKHRDNFLKLTESGFYDQLIFHRIIKNFMIQGGDPASKEAGPNASLGSGGPGYTIEAEFDESLAHVKGALAAARTSDAVNPERRSSGSQFYIVQGKDVSATQLDQMEDRFGFKYPEEIRNEYMEYGGTPFLDQNYTVFGRVIEGLEVIDKIADKPTLTGDRPESDIKMKIRVIK